MANKKASTESGERCRQLYRDQERGFQSWH